MMMIYMAHFQPMPSFRDNNSEVKQDAFLLVCAYHLLLFTDYVPDVEIQYMAGWSYILVICIMLSLNIFEFVGMAFKDCRRSYFQRQRRIAIEKLKSNELKRKELHK